MKGGLLACVLIVVSIAPVASQAQTAAKPAPEATELPAVVVETPQSAKKATKKKSVSATPKAAPAPQPEPQREQPAAETATGPVKGYVATQSATGTKSDTPIVETPRSVSVVGKTEINARGGALNLGDALGYTPGVIIQNSADPRSVDTIRIRGFSAFESLYLDGLAVGAGLDRSQPQIEPYGLERVEVLKGPASILYGQSTPGGLVNMVSKRPTTEPLHEVQLQVASFERTQLAFDFSDRVDQAGVFSYRLVGVAQDSKTQVDFVDDDRLYIAPSFTWRPDQDTNFTLLTHYRRARGAEGRASLPISGTLLDSPFGKIPKSRYPGEPGVDRNDIDQYGIGYSFEKAINPYIKFVSNYRYFHSNTDYVGLIFPRLEPGTPFVNRTYYAFSDDAESHTADNRIEIKVPTGPVLHKIVGGIDYRRQDISSPNRYQFNGGPQLNIYNPVYGAPIPDLPFNVVSNRSLDQTGYYAQDTMSLENWRLSLGMRYDDAETVFSNTNGYTSPSANTAKSYNAGLLYLFDNGLAPYVSYAESFEPLMFSGITEGTLKPKFGTQYEAGLKYQPPGTSLMITSAVFDLTEQNRLAYSGINEDPVQIGEVNIRGAELEAKATIAQWDFAAGYTYLTSEVTKSVDAYTPLGNEVDVVPEHSFVMWANYKFDETSPLFGFNVGGGVRYNSSYFGDILNTIRNPSSTLFDAAIGYDFGALDKELRGIKLDINATNLTDEDNITCYDADSCYYGRGRTFIGTLKYSW